jgi:hypothetical protein
MLSDTLKEFDKELKELEMIIPDGKLSDCLVYHQSVKSFAHQFITEQISKAIDEVTPEYPTNITGERYMGFCDCVDEIKANKDKFLNN